MGKVLKIVGLNKTWVVVYGMTFIAVAFCSIIAVGTAKRVIKNEKILRAIDFD